MFRGCLLRLLLCVLACAAVSPAGAAPPAAVGTQDPDRFYEAAASIQNLQIQAAQLALEHTQDAAVRRLAEQRRDDYARAQKQLVLLATRRNVSLPRELLKPHQMRLDALMEQRGQAGFDAAYRVHSDEAQAQMRDLLDGSARDSADPDVRQIATQMRADLGPVPGPAGGAR